MADCEHKNLEVWSVKVYQLPVAYEVFLEQKEIGLEKYYVEGYQDRTVCQDCGETVD